MTFGGNLTDADGSMVWRSCCYNLEAAGNSISYAISFAHLEEELFPSGYAINTQPSNVSQIHSLISLLTIGETP